MLSNVYDSGCVLRLARQREKYINRRFDDEVTRPADKDQVLDVVAANEDELTTAVDRHAVEDGQPRYPGACRSAEMNLWRVPDKPIDSEKHPNQNRAGDDQLDEHQPIVAQDLRQKINHRSGPSASGPVPDAPPAPGFAIVTLNVPQDQCKCPGGREC